jgi:hypothetical protein
VPEVEEKVSDSQRVEIGGEERFLAASPEPFDPVQLITRPLPARVAERAPPPALSFSTNTPSANDAVVCVFAGERLRRLARVASLRASLTLAAPLPPAQRCCTTTGCWRRRGSAASSWSSARATPRARVCPRRRRCGWCGRRRCA